MQPVGCRLVHPVAWALALFVAMSSWMVVARRYEHEASDSRTVERVEITDVLALISQDCPR